MNGAEKAILARSRKKESEGESKRFSVFSDIISFAIAICPTWSWMSLVHSALHVCVSLSVCLMSSFYYALCASCGVASMDITLIV